MTDATPETDARRLHEAAWPELVVNLQTAYAELTQAQFEAERRAADLEEARDLLDQVLDSMSEALFLMDRSGRVVRTNRAASALLGREVTELVGRPCAEVLGDIPATPWRLLERSPSGTVSGLEAQVRTRSGRLVPVSITCDLVRDKREKITGVLAVVRDITELQKAEQDLRRSEEKYRTLVETTTTGFLIVDPGGRVLDANAEYVRLTGHQRLEEIVGRCVVEWTAPHDRERNAAEVQKCFERGFVRNLEIDYVDRQGRVTPIEINATVMQTDQGPRILSLCRDISERRRARKELERSNQELQQYGFFVAHELKKPVNALLYEAHELARHYQAASNSGPGKHVALIVTRAEDARLRIDKMLLYARVGEKGRRFVPTDCTALFRAARDELRGEIEAGGVAVTAGRLPTVLAEPEPLKLLFRNLIDNAIKYRGRRRLKVRVAAERQQGEWLFRVRDNGMGIKPDYQEKIFELFKRLHTEDEIPGHGIGLAYCKKVVEHHGGRMWVESEYGKGSTFLFTLPAMPATPEPAPVQARKRPAGKARRPRAEEGRPAGPEGKPPGAKRHRK
jgi:PAS domain S-box-containing protein